MSTSIEQAFGSQGARRLTFEQLRAFVAVAEDGGFLRAGELLNRSQSTVTHSLRKLEEILGCRLIERRQGHVGQLTPEGRQFLEHSRELLARAADAVLAVRVEPLRGRVRLGVPDDFDLARLHGVLARCAGLHPGLRIEVSSAQSAQLQQGFEARQLDLAVIKRPVQAAADRVGETVLHSGPMVWVHRRQVALAEFASVPMVGFAEGCCYRRAAVSALTDAGVDWYFAYSSASYANVRAAIAAGLGVGVLPAAAAPGDVQVLGAAEGFPALPDFELVMCEQADDGGLVHQVGEILARSHLGPVAPGAPAPGS